MEQSSEFDIGRYVRLIYTKRILFSLTVMIVTTALLIFTYMRPKVYEAKSIIFVERQFINDLVKNVAIQPSYEDRTRAISIVVKSRNFLMKVMDDLGFDTTKISDEYRESLIRKFQTMTDIRIDRGTANQKDVDVCIVSYVDTDPNLASNYVNTIVRRYIEENISTKQEEASGANRFLLEQINLFKDKIKQSDVAIAKLKRDKSVMRNEGLASLESKLNGLLMRYNEDHPEVIKVKAEIERLTELEKLKKEDLVSSPAATSADELNAQSQHIVGSRPTRDVSAGKKSLLDLERERDMNKRIYEELLATLGKSEFTTRVDAQTKAGAFRIIEPAIVPKKPISRNVLKMILMGIFGGIAAGFGLVIGLDLLDTSLKSVEAVKKLGLPILAIIPTIKTVRETKRVRIKDWLLYTTVGIYLIGLISIVMIEMMGLPYVDNFVQGTSTEIKSSVKRIW